MQFCSPCCGLHCWAADGYQCQTVKLTQWVMRVLPFNFTVYLSFMRGFTCHRVSMSTCCNNVECHWGNMARDLVFCPHPSITVPSALIKSAVHLLYRLLVSHRKNACPSPHLTKSKPSVVKMILTHTHTLPFAVYKLICELDSNFRFLFGKKMATRGKWWMKGLYGQWPTWMLVCDW